jgi:hypothetical protein
MTPDHHADYLLAEIFGREFISREECLEKIPPARARSCVDYPPE